MDLPSDLKHLYITWLEEQAAASQIRNLKTSIQFTRALDSLRKHNAPVFQPRDLVTIKYFGEKIVSLLEDKLVQYCNSSGYKIPEGVGQQVKSKRSINDIQTNDSDEQPQPAKRKPSRRKEYVPLKRSGGYAILLVLLEHDSAGNGMIKEAIIDRASPYCDKSFANNPKAGQFYGAWSSIKVLQDHELVIEKFRPKKYFLTEKGEILAKNLKKTGNIKFRKELNAQPGSSPLRDSGKRTSSKDNLDSSQLATEVFENIEYSIWEPGSYDINFVLDNREVRNQKDRQFFNEQLRSRGYEVDRRELTLGDGLWVAKRIGSNTEAVLDYIVERKTLDDLSKSIQDGRHTEQKVRLKRSGIKNVFYLVEESMIDIKKSMNDAIETSMSMAMTVSGFHVKRTKDSDDTVRFLSITTDQIKEFYKDKKLIVINPQHVQFQQDYKKILDKFRDKFDSENVCCVHKYHVFNTIMSKTDMMTTRELFIRLLMTIKGVSFEKAISIQKCYKTPKMLIEEFDGNDPELAHDFGKRVQELITEVFQQ